MNINCILFNNFETLDLFGPVEVFGKIRKWNINYYSYDGGNVKNNDNVQIITENIDTIGNLDILLIPGGLGTRTFVNDVEFIQKIKEIAEKSLWCLTVCTGSALLAKTGLLDNIEATSNKTAFKWVKSVNENVKWKEKARWVVDGKFYTSSGVSAGIDMSLGFICDRLGEDVAKNTAKFIEYEWHNNKEKDMFTI